MEIPVKEEVIMTDNDEKNKSDIQETLLYSSLKCSCDCSCVASIIFSLIIPILVLVFLFAPSKKIAIEME